MPCTMRSGFTVGALLAIATACAETTPQPQDSSAASASPTTLLDAPDRTFTRGPITINYRSIGNGDPILFVHGYGDNLKMWAGIADSLASTNRVLAIDTRGFGKSTKPAGVENYGLAMVDDLVALLDTAGVKQAHVVGYSMGAILAAKLALLHPHRVRTATLAAGTYHKDVAGMRAMVSPWVAELESGKRLVRLLKEVAPVLSDSQAKTFSDQLFAESDSAALVASMKSFVDMNVDWPAAKTAKVPAVFIVGVDDPLHRYSRDLGARWPNAKLVEIPATDHITIPGSPRLLEEVRLLTRANPTQ